MYRRNISSLIDVFYIAWAFWVVPRVFLMVDMMLLGYSGLLLGIMGVLND